MFARPFRTTPTPGRGYGPVGCLLVALWLPLAAAGAENPYWPPWPQLLQHHRAGLDHRFYPPRIDGLIGLGRLGPRAAEAAPELADHAREADPFEQLLALWAMARIDGGAERGVVERRRGRERERLLSGPTAHVAARTAFLARAHGGGSPPRWLDRALPPLYNAARGDDPGEALLAAWALYAIDTGVTRETADAALERVVAGLDPGDGRYTRMLRWLRLIGPPARGPAAGRLKAILADHDFGADIAARRAQTLATLATLEAPHEPAALIRFRESLIERLGHPLRDAAALGGLQLLGPYACSSGVVERLRALHGDADTPDEAEPFARAIAMCDPQSPASD